MITGFNTDVEHDGVVYHVQTEDKGLETPLILSLVYTGGAILASKRSPYDDLIAAGFDEQTLAERLQRQHKLICAAINAGRIEDLKRMTPRGGGAATQASHPPPTLAAISAEQQATEGAEEPNLFIMPEAAVPAEPEAVASETQPPETAPSMPLIEDLDEEEEDALHLGLLEERELRGGEFVTLRVRVSRGPAESRDAVPDATITLKILGTTFRPVISSARTDRDGIAIVFAALPRFTTGRAAILIRAAANGQEAEMRRIVHPN